MRIQVLVGSRREASVPTHDLKPFDGDPPATMFGWVRSPADRLDEVDLGVRGRRRAGRRRAGLGGLAGGDRVHRGLRRGGDRPRPGRKGQRPAA